MSKSSKRHDTSIELVSQNGPIPINVMMQEGVKALTKILSNQLQDRKVFDNPQQSMQFVIRNGANKMSKVNLQINKTRKKKQPSKQSTGEEGADIDDDIVELDNKSNYHVNGSVKSSEVQSENKDELSDEEYDDPELHLDADDNDDGEAEIIFDYETNGDDTPEGLSARISQMIESVLPSEFQAEAHGRLRAVVNGDELNITEIDDDDEEDDLTTNHDSIAQIGVRHNHHSSPGQREHINNSELNHQHHQRHQSRRHEGINEHEEMDDDAGEEENSEHEGCCPHHQHHNQLRNFRNGNYHDYNYPTDSYNKPNFSILLDQKEPACMFCEYYLVFGEAPRNMIKWYNRMYGYSRLPHSNDRGYHDRKGQH
ncbi:Ibd2p NDAI_0F03240 [Naumovozyma dairenensis CBS 421]|uniref:Protein IBD2 n=1 Tax=Naumovozyma dairenensis (strain ATCC 10597 / BCRC 20456 / CBS 421 / NBRC 0211 / NRRL Y-12639) TaxID=1071378 RepID=G0WCY1_NAUDC|nr:hypothetical protein NDAI_0F03240 [Naumovozyma dairenensis CBS 421]CCD25642.1 hypothetical protein NDAI_0F03240 [Naumovozyma dairenensis CBS 421]